MSLTAWWSAWKYVAILGLLLCGSLWLNLHQYVASKTAPLRADLKSATDTLDTINKIAHDKVGDDKTLLDVVRGIANTKGARTIIYRQAAATPMDANCAPGKERMDAVNQGLPPPPGATP